MSVLERTREIGVLRALGLNPLAGPAHDARREPAHLQCGRHHRDALRAGGGRGVILGFGRAMPGPDLPLPGQHRVRGGRRRDRARHPRRRHPGAPRGAAQGDRGAELRAAGVPRRRRGRPCPRQVVRRIRSAASTRWRCCRLGGIVVVRSCHARRNDTGPAARGGDLRPPAAGRGTPLARTNGASTTTTSCSRPRRRRSAGRLVVAAIATVLVIAVAGLVISLVALNRDVDTLARRAPDGSVSAAAIQPGAVTAAKLAHGAVSGGAIRTGAVGTDQLAPGAVTDARVARDALTGAAIAEPTLARVPAATRAARARAARRAVHARTATRAAVSGARTGSPACRRPGTSPSRHRPAPPRRRMRAPGRDRCPPAARPVCRSLSGRRRRVRRHRQRDDPSQRGPAGAHGWAGLAHAGTSASRKWRLVVRPVCPGRCLTATARLESTPGHGRPGRDSPRRARVALRVSCSVHAGLPGWRGSLAGRPVDA